MKHRLKLKPKRFILFLIVFVVGLIIILSLVVKYFKAKPAMITKDDAIRVKLYYYNRLKDKNESFNPEFVLPVERTIPQTKTPIQDAIRLLIKGNLSWEEKAAGFSTEFPHPEFKLISTDLKKGILTLEFTDVPGFTSGGAGRIGLLVIQIKKTAKQFPEVKDVIIKPDYIFQP